MNAEEMIESVLSGTEGDQLEQALRLDKDQVVRFEKLRVAIDQLVDDGSWFEHPPDLAARTVSFVARNRRRPLTLIEQVSTRLPFRWADFAVAASIFVAGVLTLLPAIQRLARANEPGRLRLQSTAAWQQPGAVRNLPGNLALSALASLRYSRWYVCGDASRCGHAERPVSTGLPL